MPKGNSKEAKKTHLTVAQRRVIRKLRNFAYNYGTKQVGINIPTSIGKTGRFRAK